MTPLLAHGLGGRTDLPLPPWLFGYGAGAALVISFAALVVFWPVARLEPPVTAKKKRVVEDDLGRATGWRIVGVALLLAVIAAGLFGDDDPSRNLAPVTVYVLFWVGVTVLSSLFGDLWLGRLDPYPLLARPILLPEGTERPYGLGHWPAAAGLLAFVWVELVLPDRAEPRLLAVLVTAYSALVLVGAGVYGRRFLREGDPFAAWFSLLSAMAPVDRTRRGALRLRPPAVGLASMVPKRGTVALVIVGLGSTAFDGLSRSAAWTSIIGDRTTSESVPLATIGLVCTIVVVAALYIIAMALAAWMAEADAATLADAFIHSLVPIAAAYAVAHYVSLLLLEGQTAIAAISDPFGQGWDIFNTANRPIDFTWISPNTTAYVQVAAIVLGHVAGVVLAHDRALALFPKKLATRSQYPLLAMMVLFTVGGLGLLLGG